MSRLEQLARPQERQQLLRPQHVGGAGVQGARSMQHLAPPSPGQTGGLRGRELLTNGGGRARARTLGATPKTEKKGEWANIRRLAVFKTAGPPKSSLSTLGWAAHTGMKL